jgi:zinc protease
MLRLSGQACATALLLLLLPGVLPVESLRAQDADRSATIRVLFERYQLPNGLTVILLQDGSTPTVAVEMKYHVGSKNEEPGRTGFAHLFEHVMFTGSGHVPYGLHDRLTEGVGGMNNGSTNYDVTNYFQNVPSNYLEHMLWIESDRMGWLLEGLDSAKYNAQRDIVQNERRQGVDNQPYGRAWEILDAAMYPAEHPYSWPVIGHLEDLQAAPLDAVKEFFRLYYAPNNATLAIVGDFDVQQTKAWVQKYFGDIPRGALIRRPDVPLVALSDERRLVYEDRVQVPRLYIQWPAVSRKHDDAAALQVLGDLLAGSRLARLTSVLIYEREAAASVSALPSLHEDAGTFVIMITPRPGQTLTALETVTDSLIQRLQREGPAAEEMQRTKAGAELRSVRALESNLGRALQLTTGEIYHGDPGYMFTAARARLEAVTSADVQRVARQYLGAGRVVLSIVPQGRREDAARAAESRPITDDAAHDPREDG